MKTFEERKIEIFRRSEERIRKRKKRRAGILLSCIPVFLLFSLWSVMIFPAMRPAKAEDQSVTENSMAQHHVIKAEISKPNSGVNRSAYIIEDQNEVKELFLALEDAITGDFLAGENFADQEDSQMNEDFTTETHQTMHYRIVFTDSEGNKKIYFLRGNILSCPADDLKCQLNRFQMESFSKRLELE